MQAFTFLTYIFLKVIKDQGPLEGEGVEEVASKYLPWTYFSLQIHPWKFHFPNSNPFWDSKKSIN